MECKETTKKCWCGVQFPDEIEKTCSSCVPVTIVRAYKDGRQRVMFRAPLFVAIDHLQKNYSKGENWHEFYRHN